VAAASVEVGAGTGYHWGVNPQGGFYLAKGEHEELSDSWTTLRQAAREAGLDSYCQFINDIGLSDALHEAIIERAGLAAVLGSRGPWRGKSKNER